MRTSPHALIGRRYLIGAYFAVAAACILTLDAEAAPGWLNKIKEVTKTGGDIVKGAETVTGSAEGSDGGDGACGNVGGLVGSVVGYEAASAVNAGCLVASDLAELLGQEDQEQLAKSTEQTIATGETATFEGQDSGVQGTVTVTETSTKKEQGNVTVLKDRVEVMPPLELISAEYAATATGNVRGGPGSDYKVVGSLAAGEAVQAIGKVEGQPWYLIGQGGVATGFVYESLLVATGQIGGGQPAPEGEIAQIEVDTAVTCQTIEQQITLDDGSVHTEQIEACQKPDGTWEMA